MIISILSIITDFSFLRFLLLIVLLFYFYLASNAFAISTSFSRQEIREFPYNDWEIDPNPNFPCTPSVKAAIQEIKQYFLSSYTPTKDKDLLKQVLERYFPPDISAVSYYSNGMTLNASVALSASLNESIDGDIVYHMVVEPENVYDIEEGEKSIYADEIYKPGAQKEWIRWIYEKFSNGFIRTIYKNDNYTHAFSKENNSVSFSLDLGKIGSPDRYLISFGTQYGFHVNGQYCNIIDNVGWYQIPLPEYTISVLPSSINLRPGEEKNVEVKVISNHLEENNIIIIPQSIDNLDVYPKQISLKIPALGSANSIIHVKAQENINQLLPVIRTATIDAIITVPTNTTYSGVYTVESNSLTENITESFSNFTVTLLNPLTTEEKFVAFWQSYGGFISLVGGGFAAGFAALVFNKLTKSKNNK